MGERLIADFAGVLREAFRDGDILGRIGGDEFCALALDRDDVAPLATRLDAALATVNARAGVAFPLSASPGWAVAGAGKLDDLDHLLGIADARMYEAKRSRRPA